MVQNTTFSSNSVSTGQGGAMNFVNYGGGNDSFVALEITESSTFMNNSAGGSGGALAWTTECGGISQLVMTEVVVVGNTATRDGGVMLSSVGNPNNLTSCVDRQSSVDVNTRGNLFSSNTAQLPSDGIRQWHPSIAPGVVNTDTPCEPGFFPADDVQNLKNTTGSSQERSASVTAKGSVTCSACPAGSYSAGEREVSCFQSTCVP